MLINSKTLALSFIALLSCSLYSPFSMAKNKLPDAQIFSNGKTLYAKSEERVNGSLKDLMANTEAKNNNACYEGNPLEVCQLIDIAVDEYNDKNDLKNEKELLFKCYMNEKGVIYSEVSSKNGNYFDIVGISRCL
jgi:hypothetical protein